MKIEIQLFIAVNIIFILIRSGTLFFSAEKIRV